ncbi:MAG: hypothetical protein ACOZNI_25115, partial [Myxococcota bacterium]
LMDGPSVRTRHLALDDKPSAGDEHEADRFSGTREAEFPEPAPSDPMVKNAESYPNTKHAL